MQTLQGLVDKIFVCAIFNRHRDKMGREKYLSMRKNVTGFSFANLGLFTGFASSVVSAVYSLVLLGIFKLFFNLLNYLLFQFFEFCSESLLPLFSESQWFC